MESFAFFTGTILPPITIAVFLGSMAYRIYTWSRLPYPKMTLFPAPEGATFGGVLKATFLFPSLFKGDKFLWCVSWCFHAVLALIFIGHIRVFIDFPALWAALNIDADRMSATVGGAAGVVCLVLLLLLIARRFTVQRVREISNAGDHFALFLLLGIFLTGNAMRFGSHFDLTRAREYFQGLFTLSFPTPPLDGWFLMHFLLGQVLLLYIPFSKILHFGGIFFTEAAIQRR